ncbi:MAG: lysine--tRNA ligase, partial [Candidatus Eremiobacteraeota bacterium]|nr:lysine--tRNA ligase [Candidatus Eremiobacteraeota bacterium]
MSEADLVAARRANLAELRAHGVDPFATLRYEVTAHASELHERYASLAAGEEAAESYAVAGRLMSIRSAGKTFFADVVDRTGKTQIYVRKDTVGEERFAAFAALDRGDLVGAHGRVFRSKMGELTLRVDGFEIVGKSLQPLPDKWHGLTDVEKRYRQRYVDLIMNAEVRETFIARSRIVAEMRRFIDARGFLEVETPVLLNVAGGAAARRFHTHVNALDIEVDLRIATELNLKRLIVGGLERVYEIGRCYRNEGISTRHNPEFTILELYRAYATYTDLMDLTEELLRGIDGHLASAMPEAHAAWKAARPFTLEAPFSRIPMDGAVAAASERTAIPEWIAAVEDGG